jgi:hypothetical protein
MNLYRGIFNYSGYQVVMHTEASSERKALMHFVTRMSIQFKTSRRAILYAFNGNKDNFLITKIDKSKVSKDLK